MKELNKMNEALRSLLSKNNVLGETECKLHELGIEIGNKTLPEVLNEVKSLYVK
jgi:hypothetical protein